jgi:hypothetical protein
MRLTLAMIVAAAVTLTAAHAGTEMVPGATQRPGIVIPQSGTSWLLGNLTEKLQVSHSVAFGFSSGGPYSGPSGLYMTRLAYPFASNLDVSASFGLNWDPSFADATGQQSTNYGLRELRLDWRPSEKTHISFGYVSHPSRDFLLRQDPFGTWGWTGGHATWGADSP